MSDVDVGEVTLGNTPSSTTTCSGHYMPVSQQRPMKAEMCKHFRVGYTINQSRFSFSRFFVLEQINDDDDEVPFNQSSLLFQ